MSTTTRQPIRLVDARSYASEVVHLLYRGCAEIAIAGSIRRDKPAIKDIEIVARPKTEPITDLWGAVVGQRNLLDDYIAEFIANGRLRWNSEHKGNGPKYKRLWHPAGIAVDLFLADTDNWGNQLVIRTGDWEFSKVLMTPRLYGGCMPVGMRQADGYLWDGQERVPCPTEADYFAALGIHTVPAPETRTGALARQLAREVRP